MTRAIRAALIGLALAAFATPPCRADEGDARLADPGAEYQREPGIPGVFIPLGAAERPPGLAEPAPDRAVDAYASLLLFATVIVAALIFISGIDDAFLDACYWLRRARRRGLARADASARARLADLDDTPEAPLAIMVPAWKEHDVIAAMIENTVRTLDYKAYRIFCGVYRNDPDTACEVDRMAARHPGRVIRVEVPHDGPTCKADCLNHIVARVLGEERASGSRFAGMVLHDSEDVIHPLELRLFNALVPGTDLVQLPVFSLERKWTDFTAGTYIDDFAESHGKDISVREALVGIVPGAGVATCYSRRCMAALWSTSAGDPFNTASLTEDYDLSFRLKDLNMSQTFAHVTVDPSPARAAPRGRTAGIVATHEYFPDRFKAAYRQRARWVLGIAFQGWRDMRWRGGALERYFLFRDRKSIVMAPVCILAYLLLAGFVLGAAFGSPQLHARLHAILSLPVLQEVLLVNVAFMMNRAFQRTYFVTRYYGALHGLLALVRMPLNNLINFCAVMRAWRLFGSHVLTGKKLAWDKTAHVYPDAQALAAASRPLPRIPAVQLKVGIAALVFGLSLLAGPNALADPPPLTGRAYELADGAYKALDRNELERAMRLASEALQHAPGHASLLLIQADILGRQGRHAEALELMRGLRPDDLGVQGLAQRGYLHLQSGSAAAAEADFTAAVRQGGLSAPARSNIAAELAYLALRRRDDAAALEWFQMALESPEPGKPTAGLYADAGYAALRLGRNRVAAELLSKAVDEWDAAPPGKKPFDEAGLYGMRRSIETVTRRWSAAFSVGHSSTQATAGSGLATGGRDLRVLQAGAEIAYTPEFGYRNERIFQLYANTFQSLSANDPGYATGSDSQVAGLGVRFKPLERHNLVFAFERRLALGAAAGENDWLTRIGWSASRETDWNPTRSSWTTWQAYTETVYFINAARLIQPFELRVGQSWKVPHWHGAVITPYVGIAGEYDRAQVPSMAAGVGPGVAFRYWFGETAHRAFPSRLDLSIQYRLRLTEARRGGGVFAQARLAF